MPTGPGPRTGPVDYATAVGHDLRQPLHALSISATTLRLLAAQRGDAALQALAGDIDRALDHAHGLLDALLDAASLGGGAPPCSLQPVDLGTMLDDLTRSFAPQAARQGLALAVHAAPATARRQAWTDPALLRRLLDNLVGNALKFTRAGGVALRLEPTDDDALRLTVTDTGNGQVPDGAGEPPVPGHPAGRGLGIAIVRQLAGQLGITVHWQRTPGRGTAVALRLPATSAAAAASSASSGDRPARRSRRAPGPSSAG